MPRKRAAKFECKRCGKKFTMAMHLGRHMATIHGPKPKVARPKKAANAAGRRGRPVGRPAGVAGRLGLRRLSLDQLVDVIAFAKEEAGRRLTEMMDAIK